MSKRIPEIFTPGFTYTIRIWMGNTTSNTTDGMNSKEVDYIVSKLGKGKPFLIHGKNASALVNPAHVTFCEITWKEENA